MNNIVKISNPMLVGAMALLKKKNSPENRKLFVDELLHAKLLAPVMISPAPEVDENGKRTLAKDSKMTFPMMKSNDEKRFFTVFTDLNEMRQIKADGYLTVIPVSFKSMGGIMAASGEGCSGIAINPYGESIVLNRKYVEEIAGPFKKAEEAAPEQTAEDIVAAEMANES